MSDANFLNALWERQKEYIAQLNQGNYFSRFKEFRGMFNYFQRGQAVAQIACGNIMDDLFLTMERVGREGKIILIDDYPEFLYDRALKVVGQKDLSKGKSFYVKTEEGRNLFKELFDKANIEVYVQHLPPYPEQITDGSLNHVMAINAAFELMATKRTPNKEDVKPDVEGLIAETYKKLKRNGSFIVQGIMGDDIDLFRERVYETVEKNNLRFEEDKNLPESLHKFPTYAGYWGRWVKK